MTTTPTPPSQVGTADPEGAVLSEVADTVSMMVYAECRQLELAVEWAHLHPGEDVDQTTPYGDRDLQVAGDGAPTVAEFAIADLGLALGVSTDAARTLIGDAVELHHRLPALWEATITGRIRVWKARRIAQATRALPPEAAAYVDRHLAQVASKVTYAQVDRTVDKAKALFDPETLEAERARHADDTYVRVRTEDVTTTGKVYIDALVDLPVALAFERAVAGKAHQLLTEHPDLDLDQRRALALGQLGSKDTATEVVLYTHVRPEQPGLVDVDNTRSVVTTEELVEWCSLAGAKVTVRPVLDLAADLHTHRYTPTPEQHEQAILLNPTCVFPHCHRPSRGCDLDHVVPWPLGPTATWNLAPLCRGHHRLKTHGDWTYLRTSPTTFLWTSPQGQTHPGRHTD